jgi:hypothetical protein
MSESELQSQLELWMTREELAAASIELWQYRAAEAKRNTLEVAQRLRDLKGANNGNQSS